jgi:hypothetical protein
MEKATENASKYYSFNSERIVLKEEVTPFAEIWKCPQSGAQSLHAKILFKRGDIISSIGARNYVKKPNYLSVQVGEERHILLDPVFLQYINHSCDPNTHFDTVNMQVVCLKEIGVGEQMTFFYPSTEWSMAQSFDCLCDSVNCLKTIQGAKHLPSEVLEKYQFSNHILNRF